MIKARDPVRGEFSDKSTGAVGGRYYAYKGEAICAFDEVLRRFGYCLDEDNLADFHYDAGRKVIDVHNKSGDIVGCAVLSWYRVDSGRYEFTGYLS